MTITTTEVYQGIGISINESNPELVIPEADITQAIADAKIEFMALRGYQFTEQEDVVERITGNNLDYIHVRDFPITELSALEINGTSITISPPITPAAPDNDNIYVNFNEGKIQLKSDGSPEKSIFSQSANYPAVKVTYNWQDELTENFEQIIKWLAVRIALNEHIYATYDNIANETVGGRTISKGMPYTNMDAAMRNLNKKIDDLLNKIPYKPYIS